MRAPTLPDNLDIALSCVKRDQSRVLASLGLQSYICAMKTGTLTNITKPPILIGLAIVLVGAAGTVAYAQDGIDVVVRLVETGLAWCF